MVTGICDLPADCLALVASLTSPGDACRLAATAVALRAAADSEQVWGSFLPADCADILARCSAAGDERRREGETNKELFSRLCDCPVLLDGGKLVISFVAQLLPFESACAYQYISSDIGIYRSVGQEELLAGEA